MIKIIIFFLAAVSICAQEGKEITLFTVDHGESALVCCEVRERNRAKRDYVEYIPHQNFLYPRAAVTNLSNSPCYFVVDPMNVFEKSFPFWLKYKIVEDSYMKMDYSVTTIDSDNISIDSEPFKHKQLKEGFQNDLTYTVLTKNTNTHIATIVFIKGKLESLKKVYTIPLGSAFSFDRIEIIEPLYKGE